MFPNKSNPFLIVKSELLHLLPASWVQRWRPRRMAGGAVLALALNLVGMVSAAPDLTLTWDANSEPDLAGYRLHYGRSSGRYIGRFDVGPRTTAELALSPGSKFYFVVTAYNTAGLESPVSNEVLFTMPTEEPPPDPLSTPPPDLVTPSGTLLAQSLEPETAQGDLPGSEIVASGVHGLPDGSYQFRVRAMMASSVTIYASSDLGSWSLLGEVPNPTGVLLVRDLQSIGLPQRFYRVAPGP